MKNLIKRILPKRLILVYHYVCAVIATAYYGNPSRKMIVVGVTGTKGKTSTINYIWTCLSAGGYKTGLIGTANIRVGETEYLNRYHMSMPGSFKLQKLVAEMVKEGCKYCIVETTSEGIKQYRHIGIQYDVAVFTNLSPEHLEAHNRSFDEYRSMKTKIFSSLASSKKIIDGKKIDKVIIANSDNENFHYFVKFKADKTIMYSINNTSDYKATNITSTDDGVSFSVGDVSYRISQQGRFNVYNALPAIIISKLAGISDGDTTKGLYSLRTIPGRMEIIESGQDFRVIVDYAHEKESMTNLLQTAISMRGENSRIIILLGAEGGGRDKAKRPIIGELAGRMADYVVVTNVDPYDDDPLVIMEDIAKSAEQSGKIRNSNLFVIEDRRRGIQKAISLAGPRDIVLITGKGAEQSIVIAGKRIAWDDRNVVREELEKYKS